jgi:hypothetical protein
MLSKIKRPGKRPGGQGCRMDGRFLLNLNVFSAVSPAGSGGPIASLQRLRAVVSASSLRDAAIPTLEGFEEMGA